MPPQIATIVFALGILVLFLLDRDRKSQVSPALWIPVVWVSIGASRMVSQWLGLGLVMESPDQYSEGSPLDRLILAGLLVAGLIVLLVRGRSAGTFLRENGPLLIFFLYAALSVLWSEYPVVTFKRWTKAVGNLVMVLVVLTDPNPSAAVKRLLARVAFLLIPLSVLVIKYYPELGRDYHRWTWEPMYRGVATTKNGLGVICLVFGLGSVWRFLEAFHDGERPRVAGSLIAHGAVLAMALWLFWKVDSVTSLGCFLMGGGLIAFMSWHEPARRQTVVHVLTGAVVFLTLCVLFLGIGTGLLEAMGRDATLGSGPPGKDEPVGRGWLREFLAGGASRDFLGVLLLAPEPSAQRVPRDLSQLGLDRGGPAQFRHGLGIPEYRWFIAPGS